MATYKEIKGLTVQNLSADPTLNAGTEGQVWFNSTAGKLKSLVAISAWSSATNCITARRLRTGFGTQDAGTMAFGYGPGAGVFNAEEFNGSAWSTGGTSPTPLTANDEGSDQVGTSGSSGLSAGGYRNSPAGNVSNTNEYDGTSWSGGGALPAVRAGGIGGFGSVAAGVVVGGRVAPIQVAITDEYASSTWTNVNDLNTARKEIAGCGPQSAGLAVGGGTPSTSTANVEEYDATSWAAGADLPSVDQKMGAVGNSGDCLAYGGAPSPSTATTDSQTYDGSAWTAGPSLATATYTAGHFGTVSAAVYSSGQIAGGGYVNGTQIFNKDIFYRLPGAWAAGTNLNAAASGRASAGTQTAGLAFGGYAPAFSGTTETYDGTTWTEVNNLNTARAELAGCGTQTLALAFGGQPPLQDATEEYDGTSWVTSPGSLNTARHNLAGCGIQTLALAVGGDDVPGAGTTGDTEEYNGSVWSEESNLNTARTQLAAAGTQTASVAFGGDPGSTEEYNGTAWTAGNSMITTRRSLGGAGIQTNALGFAGDTGGYATSALSEGYDGTNWSTSPSLGTARYSVATGPVGTASSTLCIGGQAGPLVANVEEFTGETETATASNITSS